MTWLCVCCCRRAKPLVHLELLAQAKQARSQAEVGCPQICDLYERLAVIYMGGWH